MNQPQPNQSLHTYADYRNWPANERWELIDGVAHAMGPAPLRLHQKVLLQLARQVADALDEKTCEAYIAPFDVRLPKSEESNETIDTVVQPDLSVICDPAKLDDKGCRGAPDWIVEVLSPATASYDHLTKRALYERAGVREFWLVHPVDRIATIYRQIAPQLFGPAEFVELTGQTPVGILPDIIIDWARVVGPVDQA